MRSLDASRKRWATIFPNGELDPNLRQAVRDSNVQHSPCEEGLRSVCWKVFLLLGSFSEASWPKKLSEWRSIYSSLSDHFLKYIDHPNDLQTDVDPLADDESSPWNAVRQDEINRAEILQDVKRCMQDVPFFHKPSTQQTLLDILFIYSKLHPDVGYRQGMHELLAIILWIVHCDAVDTSSPANFPKQEQDTFMLEILDQSFIKHDTFTLFCAVMQVAKTFYEVGELASPIVERSRRIHESYLVGVDPQLATHLHAIEILPQIFLIRWMRLLFIREFSLEDTLSIWDTLFAENLDLSLIEMTCLAMLLRIRWQLLEVDSTEALHLLLHFEPPSPPHGPVTLVRDAVLLAQSMTSETGASIIAHYSGRRPTFQSNEPASLPSRPPSVQLDQKKPNNMRPHVQGIGSPTKPPTQPLTPQKGLESLFQEVSGNLQKRTEHWKIPKAVRDAVGEVRRNVNHLQSGRGSPRRSVVAMPIPIPRSTEGYETMKGSTNELAALERRNQSLARVLGDVMTDLNVQTPSLDSNHLNLSEDSFYDSLAKIQMVQLCLADSEFPIPEQYGRRSIEQTIEDTEKVSVSDQPNIIAKSDGSNYRAVTTHDASRGRIGYSNEKDEVSQPQIGCSTSISSQSMSVEQRAEPTRAASQTSTYQPLAARTALVHSPFSWMLGEGQHRSDFVASTPPPEQRRDSIPKSRPKKIFPDGRDGEVKQVAESEDDGFILSPLAGGSRLRK